MAEITRPSGVKIRMPPGYDLKSPGTTPRSRMRRVSLRRPIPIAVPLGGPSEMELGAIITALEKQALEVVDHLDFEPRLEATSPAGTRRRGAARVPAAQTAEVELKVAPEEEAVLLVEQDGVYSWVLPTEIAPQPVVPLRRGKASTAKRIVFQVEIHASSSTERRRDRRGFFTDLVYAKVKALVLKFVAHAALRVTMKYLERNISPGIVIVDSEEPGKWQRVDDFSAVTLPKDRGARLLLLIHGTFSTTQGGFGALGGTPWGRKFLQGAFATYDAVIGFDHPSLSEDPLSNAKDLLARLEKAQWPHPPKVDVVAHSRGGLVFRSLVEHLLPASKWKGDFRRSVFVGCTNNGTKLADADNWRALVDLYTNLGAGAMRLMALMPHAAAVTGIFSEIISSLGALVKYLATDAVEGGVPGLASMEPKGSFVTTINQTQSGQPSPADVDYYAITSVFEPQILGGVHAPKELPQRLVLALADGFVDQLMGAPNDLVVDTASMTAIDPQAGRFVRDTFDFGATPEVYHTIYFLRPEVTNALTRWLQLVAPPTASIKSVEGEARDTRVARAKSRAVRRGATKPARKSRQAGRKGSAKGGARQSGSPGAGRAWSPRAGGRKISITRERLRPRKTALPSPALLGKAMPLGETTSDIPAMVDTDILITDVHCPVSRAVEAIKAKTPSYLVLQRRHQGKMLNYALDPEEFLTRATTVQRPKQSVIEAFDLHETGASKAHSLAGLRRGLPIPRGREVVISNDEPVGVLVPKIELANADLVGVAHRTMNPRKTQDLIVARRMLPTFTPPAAPPPPGEGPSKKVSTVTCHFRAEMEEEVLVKHVTTVEVTVSREMIGGPQTATRKETKGKVDPQRKLLLQVIPKQNFDNVGDDRVEIDPPAPGQPASYLFDVRATDEGPGELWVIARQGQAPLMTLRLTPLIVGKKTNVTRRSVKTADAAEPVSLPGPFTQLLITEKRNGDQFAYRFQFESPELNLYPAWRDSAPIKGDREVYVNKVYSEIEERWISSKEDVASFYNELRDYGADLLKELIPAELQKVLWDNRKNIRSIRVVSEDPFIPWELIHLKEPGKPLGPDTCFLGEMGLVRWLHTVDLPQPTILVRPGKSRYVIPDYPVKDLKLPETRLEGEFLKDEFDATSVPPHDAAVRKLLAEPGGFDVLHFAGHGEAETKDTAHAALVLEGRIEKNQYISELFRATAVSNNSAFATDQCTPLVVLNACQVGRAGYKLTSIGGFAEAFISNRAAVFVGTLWSVGDVPARTFTEEFYCQLKDKKATVAAATSAARSKSKKAGDATWLAYVVYGHPATRLKFSRT